MNGQSNSKHERAERMPVEIRKGDMVRVIAGRDRLVFANRTSRVLSVDRVKGTVTVEHAHIIKKHTKRNPQKNIQGGVLDKEAPIDVSNVMLVCPGCNRPTRIGHKTHQEGGKAVRQRVCKRCGDTLDK
jgi:large subunit ribosomal protein L24